MPVPLIDDTSQASGVFRDLLESAFRKTLPFVSSALAPDPLGIIDPPTAGLGGEQLRSLAMPSDREIVVARRRLHAKAALIGFTAHGFCHIDFHGRSSFGSSAGLCRGSDLVDHGGHEHHA